MKARNQLKKLAKTIKIPNFSVVQIESISVDVFRFEDANGKKIFGVGLTLLLDNDDYRGFTIETGIIGYNLEEVAMSGVMVANEIRPNWVLDSITVYDEDLKELAILSADELFGKTDGLDDDLEEPEEPTIHLPQPKNKMVH